MQIETEESFLASVDKFLPAMPGSRQILHARYSSEINEARSHSCYYLPKHLFGTRRTEANLTLSPAFPIRTLALPTGRADQR